MLRNSVERERTARCYQTTDITRGAARGTVALHADDRIAYADDRAVIAYRIGR